MLVVSPVDPTTFQPITDARWDSEAGRLTVESLPHIATIEYSVALEEPDWEFEPSSEFTLLCLGPDGAHSLPPRLLEFRFREQSGLAVFVLDGQLLNRGTYTAEVRSKQRGLIRSCTFEVTTRAG